MVQLNLIFRFLSKTIRSTSYIVQLGLFGMRANNLQLINCNLMQNITHNKGIAFVNSYWYFLLCHIHDNTTDLFYDVKLPPYTLKFSNYATVNF